MAREQLMFLGVSNVLASHICMRTIIQVIINSSLADINKLDLITPLLPPGLIGVLQERRRFLGEAMTPVQLLAPIQISSFLNYYNHCIESIVRDYELVSNKELVRTR